MTKSALVLGCAVAAACSPEPTALCRELVRQKRFPEAAVTCEQAWASTGALLAGAGAATAHSRNNDYRAVMRWKERLTGTPHEAELLVAIGRVRASNGQPGDARRVLERAVTVGRRLGDRAAVAYGAYELFRMAYRDSRYLDALVHLETAESERALAGATELRSTILLALFDVLYEIGHIDGGRRVLAAAAALIDPADPDEARYLRAKQGLVHEVDGSWALVRQAYLDALALNARSRVPGLTLTWNMTLNLLQVAIQRGDLAEARRYLAEATALQRRHFPGRKAQQIPLLRRQAMFERLAGNRPEARRLVRAARALGPPDEVAWSLATEEGELAEAAGEPDAAERAYESAIDLLERLSRGLFGGDLQEWSLAHKRRPYARLFELHVRRGQVAKAFAIWDRFQRRAFKQALVGGAAASGGDSPHAAAEEGRARLTLLSQVLPGVDSPSSAAPTAGSPAAACPLPPRWLSGLFYFEGMNDLYVLIVRNGAISIRRVAEPVARLAPLIDRFVAAPDDAGLATRLGELLVPELPVASPDEVLHVSVARQMAELPVAALRVRGRRLVDHAALAMLTSLGMLERPASPPATGAVVLADPRGDLAEARAEARETARALGVRARVGDAATRGGLLAAQRASILHLATHSGVGPAGPWLQLRDGRLLAHEIVAHKLHPRLVVMPTCASAVGSAPGVSPSLAASFLAAGSETVVGALRSIDDGASRRFVRDFYLHGGARDPVAALADVQRRWSRDRPAAEWAAFVALGGSASRSARSRVRMARATVTKREDCRLMGNNSLSTGRSLR